MTIVPSWRILGPELRTIDAPQNGLPLNAPVLLPVGGCDIDLSMGTRAEPYKRSRMDLMKLVARPCCGGGLVNAAPSCHTSFGD